MSKLREVREYLEQDLWEFAQYVNPHYCYGEVHRKVFEWLCNPECSKNQLVLMPRGHLKSHCVAVWCAWQITRDPTSTIVYLSAGEDLAKVQIYSIKSMLTTDRYQELWPEMLHPEEGKRDKWSAWAFNVDHPLRKEAGIRDHTLIIKTVRSGSTGLHCDYLVLDDVVVPENAYTETGRKDVQRAVSQFASIKNPGALTKAVGTRYHPADQYAGMLEAKVKLFDDEGNPTGEAPLWDIFEAKVENSPDQTMTGTFLWPRTFNTADRKWYGFNTQVLAEKRAEYESNNEVEQFYAQYYNDPNDPESNRLQYDNFRYYNPKYLVEEDRGWFIKDPHTELLTKLRVGAAMDVANTGWSEKGGKAADFTAIVVIGVDPEGLVYVLALDQFKTSDFDEYYRKVLDLHLYWNFREITIETNSVGKQVKAAVENRAIEEGLRLRVNGLNRTRHDGKKQERHAAVLEPRYRQGKILHFKGGLIPELEEQVILARPRHDDLEDALCIAVEQTHPAPKGMDYMSRSKNTKRLQAHPRFGGRRRR